MGTMLRAQVAAADHASGMESLEDVFLEVRRLEGVLSTWTPDSEIARVNAAPGGSEVRISPELMSLLLEATCWSRRTAGAFDPGVGALIDAWDIRGTGRHPSPAELARAVHATGVTHFAFDASSRRIRVPGGGVWLDTGGFGKGVALRAAKRMLHERGVRNGLLDFGGQVLALGASPDGGEWEIGVAHPSARGAEVARLRIPAGHSVATSAQSERFVEVDGMRFGHVLDPRTGRPVPSGWSVTVVAEDAVVADVLSTALLVMGPEEGGRWAEAREEGVLFLDGRGVEVKASWNSAFSRYRLKHSNTEGS